MLFNNTFLCVQGDIFGLMGKFFKISIFNILTSQKRDMTELKLVWPVHTTGHSSKIILSPVIIAPFKQPSWNKSYRSLIDNNIEGSQYNPF